jgi:hypothetical protein
MNTYVHHFSVLARHYNGGYLSVQATDVRSLNLLSNPMNDILPPSILSLFCDNISVAQKLWIQMSWKDRVNIWQVLWCSTAKYSAVFLKVEIKKVRLIMQN